MKIPDPLPDLGVAFVKLPGGEKGADTNRDPEHLHTATDSELQSHLAAGGNYGVVCRGELVVVDIDDPAVLPDLTESLPDTVQQVSGSGSGEHHFYHVPGLDSGTSLTDPESGANAGHVKATEQDYVVGPGSEHPSGGTYGPLTGEQIATVDREAFLDALEPYRTDTTDADTTDTRETDTARFRRTPTHGEPEIDDILSPAQYPTEQRCPHPFHDSSTGKNFKVHEGREVAYCYRHECALRGLHLWAIREGIITCADVGRHGELPDDTWREIYDALRAAGYDIPVPAEQSPAIRVLLPEVPKRSGQWGGIRAQYSGERLTQSDARERTREAIHDAINRGAQTVIDAVPSLGKSYAAVHAAGRVDRPITYLTHRHENREQTRQWAEEQNIKYVELPAFKRDCPTAAGEHGDALADTFGSLYDAGLRPSEIHKRHSDAPCQHEGRCPHAAKWDFEPAAYDLIIGHPTHANVSSCVAGRAIILDEQPGEGFETALSGEQLHRAVAALLSEHDTGGADSLGDLRVARNRDQWKADILTPLLEYDDLRAPDLAATTAGGHADAPAAAVALLTSEQLDNGLEYASLEGTDTAMYDPQDGVLWIRRPPDLSTATAVLGLDGTPCMRLWHRRLRCRLDREQVLTDSERQQYLTDVLGNRYYQTTPHVRPYSSGEWVNAERDTALLAGIADHHGDTPAAITSAQAEQQLFGTDGPAAGSVDSTEHYGNLTSSNQYAERSLGVVLGSPHFGDRHIQRLAALEGKSVTADRDTDGPLSYSGVGDAYLRHVREHSVAQAALRFGRDGSGATVYLNTSATPEWLPTEQVTGAVRVRSDGEADVLQALGELDRASTSVIADRAGLSPRQTRRHLSRLTDTGAVRRVGSGPATEYVAADLPDDPAAPETNLPETEADTTRTAALSDSIRGGVRIAHTGTAGHGEQWALRGVLAEQQGIEPVTDPPPAD